MTASRGPEISPAARVPAEPGRAAALSARDDLEAALFALPEIPLALDRIGVRDRLLRAVQYLYAVLDSALVTAVHLDGLNEAANVTRETRALLDRAGDASALAPLGDAIARLDAAEGTLRRGAQAVADIQMARRDELAAGSSGFTLPPARPFRASVGEPSLHAFARPPVLPHVIVDPSKPLPEPAPAPVTLPRPRDFAELATFAADAASGAIEARLREPESAADAPPPAPLPFSYLPAVGEAEVLRRLGRDCLEDIANYRNLRKPNAIESWLDQEPFEQRLLDNLDAFAAVGGAALPLVTLFNAEAEAPDPERAFAVALTLGCIEGTDTVGAAVMTLKQSAPETFPGWIEGFFLAPNPAIDVAMSDLATSRRADLVALALDVLLARAALSDSVVERALGRSEAIIARRVARALGCALPRDTAIDALERMVTTADDQLFVAAAESLIRRRHGPVLDLLRDAARAPHHTARALAAPRLLALAGGSGDVDLLLAALRAEPTVALIHAVGRFGHTLAVPALLDLLAHDDKEVRASASIALERLTGAGLREIVEEPWEIDLPPEADADRGIPVPPRKLSRVVVDQERWFAWVHDNANNLDTEQKTRAGGPFTLLQVVDELEARSTPPAHRADAALELSLLSGMDHRFSPDDWVARQKRHLAELRTAVLGIAFSPGTWWVPGRHSVVASSPASSASRSPAKSAAAPERGAEPSPSPIAAMPSYLAAKAPSISDGTPMPTVNRAPAALTGTAMGFIAPKLPALPFAPAASGAPSNQPTDAKSPANPEDAPAPVVNRAPAALTGTAMGFIAPKLPALPFAPAASGVPSNPTTDAKSPANPEGAPTPAVNRAPAALTRTAMGFIAPKLPALPFAPAASASPANSSSSAAAPVTLASREDPAAAARAGEALAANQPTATERPGTSRVVTPPPALSGTVMAFDAPRVPPLPFRAAASGAPTKAPSASEAPALPSVKSAPAALTGTSVSFGAPATPVLPFATSTGGSLTRAQDEPRSMATLTSGEGRDALNQRSVPQSTSPAVIAASSASAPAAPASAEVAATSKLTLQQYASLCAELAVFKDRTESIFQRYGLATLRDRLNVDLGWQERLRQNPAEQAAWEALYRRWLAHFEEEKGA